PWIPSRMVILIGIQNAVSIRILAGRSVREVHEMMGMMNGTMGGMMDGGGGMMSGFGTVAMGLVMGFSALFWLAVTALVLLAIVWLVRDLRSRSDRTRGDSA